MNAVCWKVGRVISFRQPLKADGELLKRIFQLVYQHCNGISSLKIITPKAVHLHNLNLNLCVLPVDQQLSTVLNVNPVTIPMERVLKLASSVQKTHFQKKVPLSAKPAKMTSIPVR